MTEAADVALINMPFNALHTPSLGLGLLKAGLLQKGISVKVLYFTIKFGALIGEDRYNYYINNFLGEWCFSNAVFDQSSKDVQSFINDILVCSSEKELTSKTSENIVQSTLDIRDRVAPFLEECLLDVISLRPRIIGFSSMFRQNMASLALAALIKKHLPDTFIVFGGSNCTGVMGMEMVRRFNCIDAVVSGEGDIIFPQLVKKVLAGHSLSGIEGVYTHGMPVFSGTESPSAPIVNDMDTLPYPDFDDFFAQMEQSRLRISRPVQLLMETSRGCWWAEKAPCRFCGLNGSHFAFRKKTARRALDELDFLSSRYPDCGVNFTDNILSPDYFRNFIPGLIDRRDKPGLFFEVKSNLKKEEVQLLSKAGIACVQPGIESFSNNVLKLMRKGVTALQNIQFLKWCEEHDIVPKWNILWGIPGEDPEEYVRMAELIPHLIHLSPPETAGPISLDRFSPFFLNPRKWGFRDVVPLQAYKSIYKFQPDVIRNLAYHFTYDRREADEYTQPLLGPLHQWKEGYTTSELISVDKGKKLYIWDERPAANNPLTVLTGLERRLYLACDAIRTTSRLISIAADYNGRSYTKNEIAGLLEPMIAKGLIVRDGGSYLGLAIPVGTYKPEEDVLRRLDRYLEESRGNALTSRVKITGLPENIMVSREEIKNSKKRISNIESRISNRRSVKKRTSKFDIGHSTFVVFFS